MLEPGNAGKKLEDFLGAEHDGQPLGLLGHRNDLRKGPFLMEGDSVEKAKSGHGNDDGTGSQLLFVCQVDLIGANLVRA